MGLWHDGLSTNTLNPNHTDTERVETTEYIFVTVLKKVVVYPRPSSRLFPRLYLTSIAMISSLQTHNSIRLVSWAFGGSEGILSFCWGSSRLCEARGRLKLLFAGQLFSATDFMVRHQGRICRLGCLVTSRHERTHRRIQCNIILLPHCVRYSQLAPSYEELSPAIQANDPVFLIADVNEGSVESGIECRVEVGKIKRTTADRAIAAMSSLCCQQNLFNAFVIITSPYPRV